MTPPVLPATMAMKAATMVMAAMMVMVATIR